MAQTANIIDLRDKPYLQVSAKQFSLRLYETIHKLEAVRNQHLDDLKSKLAASEDPLDTAVLLIHMSMSGRALTAELAAMEDILNRVVAVSKRIEHMYLYANTYSTAPENATMMLTLQQAEDLGL